MPPLPEQNIRGVKRKRPNSKESEENKEAKLRRKLARLSRQELCKVVKKARTFEVQKTLKKLKDARRKDPESDVTKDLEAQVEILKHLNYGQLAHSALMTKLKKDKTLSSDPTIQAVSVELASNLVSPGAPGTPTAKVQSRMLSSKVLASEVISIVETLKTFLHPLLGPEGIEEAPDNFRALPNSPKKRITGTGHEEVLFSSKDNDNAIDLSGEGSDGGYESTSGDESVAEVNGGWESGTVGAPSESDDSVADEHDFSSDDSSEADFPEDRKSKKSQSHGSKGQSEFLPSLSVGFTRGDSGSEFSGSETKLVDGIKRNRRGQRARRAIWEKKFGRNANHVKKRQQQDAERRQPGSIPVDRRSGKGNSSSRPRVAYGHEQDRRPTLRRSEGVTNSGSTKGQSDRIRRIGDIRRKEEERPLHPSWEAKRKQTSASIIPSQGTKIVF